MCRLIERKTSYWDYLVKMKLYRSMSLKGCYQNQPVKQVSPEHSINVLKTICQPEHTKLVCLQDLSILRGKTWLLKMRVI